MMPNFIFSGRPFHLDRQYAVCVVLHDVAPPTWPACEKLLDAIDALGRIPVTLLVVPEYHYGHPFDESPAFVRAIEARIDRGDEVAMQGCFHLGDLPLLTPRDVVRRRICTTGDGEFAALTLASARKRLLRGLEPFRRLGWPLRGFVAPAWTLSAGSCVALSGFPFAYTTTRRRVFTLPEWRSHDAMSLVWSVRSELRRRAFGLFNRYLLNRHRKAPLLRFGIHPVDTGHAEVVKFWIENLRASLAMRVPMTKSAWLATWGA